MEKKLIIKDGNDLVKAEKWARRVLSGMYVNIRRANHGKKLYFEAHFVNKEAADAVGPFSTGTNSNGTHFSH